MMNAALLIQPKCWLTMRRILVLAVCAMVALTGCTTGKNAVAQTGSADSRYVAGDGKTIVYPVDKRKPAPALSGSTVEGGTEDLASLKGSVVVVNFWASWCPPCRLESTDLEKTYQSTKDSGVAFIGVNSRDEQDTAKAFADARLTYPSLYDPSGKIALSFSDVPPDALPTTLIIDRSGRVAVAIRNTVRQDTLTPLVQQIAAEQ
jgi:peroxiredoxin